MKRRRVITLIIFIVMLCAAFSAAFVLRSSSEKLTLSSVLASQRDEKTEAILDSMTLEEKVGQMFMGCFYSGTPSADKVQGYGLGGVLLFQSSFTDTSRKALAAKLNAIDEACEIDPAIAVDEEGGTVNRVSSSPAFRSEPFSSPRKLYDAGGLEAVVADVHEKNELLTDLGIDLNLAPVCDISTDPKDFMYARSLGRDAKTTAEYTAAVVAACEEDGIGCCLKHFPGYGNTADTHNGAAVDNRTLRQLESSDLLPFKAGIAAGAPFVLVSHNIVSAIDADVPASLSSAVHALLRYDLDFDGIIITDDLSMGAVSVFSPDADSAVTAVLAGNDMLCTGNYAQQYDAVLEAVRSGIISEERIDSSVRRILTWKSHMSLI